MSASSQYEPPAPFERIADARAVEVIAEFLRGERRHLLIVAGFALLCLALTIGGYFVGLLVFETFAYIGVLVGLICTAWLALKTLRSWQYLRRLKTWRAGDAIYGCEIDGELVIGFPPEHFTNP